MIRKFGKFERLAVLSCLTASVLFIPSLAKAQGEPIYYESFYEDYYKAFPDSKPKEKMIIPKNDPYLQYQVNGNYNQTMYPQNSVASYYKKNEYELDKWYFDIEYKKGFSHFFFETDVGSILTWDELSTTETIFKASRDFMIRNRQYVFYASYGTGSGSTDRTSDDDVYNSLHKISLGSGDVSLSNWSLGLGLRNYWKLGNWDLTPVIGYKQKNQDLSMSDHYTPAPFYLEAKCTNTIDDGNGNEICGDSLPIYGNVYYAIADADGNIERDDSYTGTLPSSIPGGIITLSNGYTWANLGWQDHILSEDFCFHTDGQNPNEYVCLEAGNFGINLVDTFGGVSSLFGEDGVSHIYNVSWTGPYIGINAERKFSEREDVKIYAEYFLPYYKVWADWPNRTDWLHDPSFYDEGGTSWGVLFNLDYKYYVKPNVQIKAGIDFEYLRVEGADTELFFEDGFVGFYPGALLQARWRNYGFNIGVSFKL